MNIEIPQGTTREEIKQREKIMTADNPPRPGNSYQP
jgi:hypothetical protein